MVESQGSKAHIQVLGWQFRSKFYFISLDLDPLGTMGSGGMLADPFQPRGGGMLGPRFDPPGPGFPRGRGGRGGPGRGGGRGWGDDFPPPGYDDMFM